MAETQFEAVAHLADLAPALFRPVAGEGRAERRVRAAVLEPAPDAFWRVAEVEEWARTQGAELVMLRTWADSPESVPFYERIGYRRRAIIFQKEL